MESKGRIIILFIANLLFVLATIGLVIFASVYWDSAEKKDYDMSGVVFDDLTVEYDGLPHSISATNLPKGVTASYENNDQTDMGEYVVTAHFKGDEKRYNPIPDMTAVLNIIQPARSRIMSAIGFEIDETSEPPRIFGDVSNTTEYIDLTDKITVTPNCTWKLYRDFDGKEELAQKTIDLEIGHNTAYIIICDPNDNASVYEVDVYRLSMKSYTFKNEGQVHASGTIEEKSRLEAPEAPEKPYYTFTGWEVEGRGYIAEFPYKVTEDITFTAQYSPINYTITYYLDGGINAQNNPAHYNIQSPDIELLPASREGYSFDGWYEDRDYGTPITVIEHGSHGSKELYAKWAYGSGGLIYEQAGNEYKVTGYKGNDSEIVVPDSWKGLPVTEIGKGVFENCTRLEKLTLPFVGQRADGLTSNDHFGYIFGAGTYVGNSTSVPSSLKTVIITGGTSVAPLAFSRCESLKSITLPDTVTSIGNAAFNHCTSLESIEIPNSITSIGDSIFSGCTSLTNVVIPDSVTSIGMEAFADCTSLTGIIIPDSVKTINRYAFRNCPSLEEITLPFVGGVADGTGNSNFGYIFGADTYQSNSNYVPSSLKTVIITGGTSIASYAFYGCRNVSNITIPESVVTIGGNAFRYCTGIEKVTFAGDSKLTEIGVLAFSGCTNIKSISIPGSVAFIRESAFSGLSNLTALYVTDIESWCNIEFGNFDSNPLYWAQNLYLNDKLITQLEIPDGVTAISDYAFFGYKKLTSIRTGANSQLALIGKEAFKECTSLATVVIPNSLTYIAFSAFMDCDRLTAVYITDMASWCKIRFSDLNANPLNRAQNLYLNYNLVTQLEIPDSVTSIGSYTFYAYKKLTSIKAGASSKLVSVGTGAFRDCTSLTVVTLPDSLTYIVSYMFYGCENLKVIVISDSVNYIAERAFGGCKSLTNIEIPDDVTYIGEAAFAGCASFSRIEIPNGVTSIGNSMFSGCTSLKDIIIPYSVTSIGNYAFNKCTSLASIVIPDRVTSIGSSAFGWCESLTNIIIPDSVTEIGNYAFYCCKKLTSAIFKCINEWTADDISISGSDLGNPATAAKYLTDTYLSKDWKRSEYA